MGREHETGMDLLIEAADALDMAGNACETKADAILFASLADRILGYLALSRPTTTLGMPRIAAHDNRSTDDTVIQRSGSVQPTHIRLLPN